MTETRKENELPMDPKERAAKNVKKNMIRTPFDESITFGQAVVTHHYLNQSSGLDARARSTSPQKEVMSNMSAGEHPVS